MKKGSKHSEESRLKLSLAHLGHKWSEKQRLAQVESHKGFHHTEEAKRKIREAKVLPINTTLLRQFYIEDKLSMAQVADRMGIPKATIQRNLHRLGLVRSPSEAVCIARPRHSVFYLARLARGHPRANKRGYVKEHVLVWEEANKMSLPEGWVIHHLNGIKTDNRPENLEAMPNSNHCSGNVNAALRRRILVLEKALGIISSLSR